MRTFNEYLLESSSKGLTPEEVKSTWKKVMPNSICRIVHVDDLGGYDSISLYLAKDVTEVKDGRWSNDPLDYAIQISDDTTIEMSLELKLDKKKIKCPTYKGHIKSVDELEIRFKEVRKFIMKNISKIPNPLFDITTK